MESTLRASIAITIFLTAFVCSASTSFETQAQEAEHADWIERLTAETANSSRPGMEMSDTLEGDLAPLTHADIEVSDRASVDAAMEAHGPDVVINTAAYH